MRGCASTTRHVAPGMRSPRRRALLVVCSSMLRRALHGLRPWCALRRHVGALISADCPYLLPTVIYDTILWIDIPLDEDRMQFSRDRLMIYRTPHNPP